jgi:hypothetical protein
MTATARNLLLAAIALAIASLLTSCTAAIAAGVRAQAAPQTGCPESSIRILALQSSIARIDACGQPYVCYWRVEGAFSHWECRTDAR